jgi:hypothetical protein
VKKKKEREKDRERQKDFEVFQKEQANIKVSRDTKNDEINQIETKGKRIKQRVVSEKINNIDKSITIVMKRKREKDKNLKKLETDNITMDKAML